MVSNSMFNKSIGGKSASKPLKTHSVSVGGGKHTAPRTKDTDGPGHPVPKIPEGVKLTNNISGKKS